MSKKISILIPVYFNEESIELTVQKVLATSTETTVKEILLVDDGSQDKSWNVIEELQKKHKEVIGVKLLQNYGSMVAIMAGLQQATGDCIVILTADLQDPPELIGQMHHEWRNGATTVFAIRTNRQDSLSTKLFASLYYYLINFFAFKGYPRGGYDYVLFDKKVAKLLLSIKEKNTNPLMQIYSLGFDKTFIEYERLERKFGKSRWTFTKKLKLFSDTFIGFTYAPIRMMSIIGIMVASFSLMFGLYQIVLKIFMQVPVQGYTTIMTTILFLGGLQISLFSILGEYLWRILDQVRNRPSYIIEKISKNNK